ncbi:hypothetical protein Leryth_009674 [Lithospermum erythrorhizon]|nr:hypothetical protein Leryth_009674 [Lithospermum erythrorhizon]
MILPCFNNYNSIKSVWYSIISVNGGDFKIIFDSRHHLCLSLHYFCKRQPFAAVEMVVFLHGRVEELLGHVKGWGHRVIDEFYHKIFSIANGPRVVLLGPGM